MKTKYDKIIYFFLISILSIFLMIINLDTPMFDDDLYVGSHQTFASLYNQAYGDYFNWNGRAVGQTFWRILASGNSFFSSMLITLVSIFLILLVYYFGKNNKQLSYRSLGLILSVSLIFLFAPVLGQTMFWRAGAGNYLFTTVLILLVILYFYQWYHQKRSFKNKIWLCLPFISFLAGWSNENTSGGALLIILAYMVLGKYYKHLQWSLKQFISVFTYLSGYLFLVLAPGNAVRTKKTMPPAWFEESSFVHFKSGFIAVTKSLIHHYLVLILLIIALSIFYFLKVGLNKSIESAIWSVSGIATLYALSFAPLGQDGGRSFFGGTIFLIISLLLLINNIRQYYIEEGGKWQLTVKLLSYTLIFLAGIKTGIGAVDAHKSNEALRDRYAYIENISALKKQKIVKVGPLKHYPKKSLSIDFGLEELHTDDPYVFPNEGYNIHFNLHGILLSK